ncbi:MAG: DNA-binding transcriptional regulator [Pirellulaceae bacterium]
MALIRRKKVALLIETSNAYARGLLKGVIAYHQQHGNWSVFLPEQERGGTPPSWLSRWKPDGIIARIENEQIAKAVKRTKRPLVDVSAAQMIANVPWVETNDHQVAKLAAEHLLQRGFRNIGFCGDPGFNWSNWRLKALQEILAADGITCHVHQSTPKYSADYSWEVESKRMAAWIKKLPKPIGILACYDIKAQQLLDVCRESDLAVPEQVAVIGVDNDPLICDLSNPPLTSIALNSGRIGFESARLLDRMMNGEQVSASSLLIDPQDIVVRQSTDVLAIDDAAVGEALRYIREFATANIRVSDVVDHVGLSRRQLEHRFSRWLGRTPHQEIQRRRIERVKQLLRTTKLPVAEVADRCGFEHPEYLCVVFQRETGQSISDYRRNVDVSQ